MSNAEQAAGGEPSNAPGGKDANKVPASTVPPTKRPSRLRRVLSRILAVGAGGIVVVIAVAVMLGWNNFGKAPEGERLERMKKSPHYKDGKFVNNRPMWTDMWGSLTGLTKGNAIKSPVDPIVPVDPRSTLAQPQVPLRVTWLGHSTVLIELEGLTILTDPIFGERTAPLSFVGPKRWYAPPIALDDLPQIDVVLISHDHYDHLDAPTMRALAKKKGITYLAPLGVGAHLEYWGIAKEAIEVRDWGGTFTAGPVTFHCTEARHASGRHLLDQNRTLWASWALVGQEKRVFYSGDTGFFPEFKDIGDKFGPFDLVMMETGAYNKSWPDWHIGPEQAVKAYRLLRGQTLLPIHWGLFDLSAHGWTEPMERVLVEAAKTSERVWTPRPGESFDIDQPNTTKKWWPDVAWMTAEEAPVQSRGLE